MNKTERKKIEEARLKLYHKHILDLRGARVGSYGARYRVPIKDVIPIKRGEQFKLPEPISIPVKHIKTASAKLVSVLLIVSFAWTGLASLGTTLSYYGDDESTNNIFIAGLVDFTLIAEPFSEMGLNLDTASSTQWGVGVNPNVFSNPFNYFASSTNFSGDLDFCNSVNVTATIQGQEKYSGPLVELLSSSTTIIDSWTFEFNSTETLPDKVCDFDIDFRGWQTRHDYAPLGGYHDIETVSYRLTTSGIRINKVYFGNRCGCWCPCSEPLVQSESATTTDKVLEEQQCECECEDEKVVQEEEKDDGITIINENESNITNTVTSTSTTSVEIITIENQNETIITECNSGGSGKRDWVELYNQTSMPISITDWWLCDGDACDQIPESPLIPPYGFALIAGTDKAFKGFHIPPEIVKIVLPDGEIGDGLKINSEMLTLRRPDNGSIDQLNWGQPDLAWAHYNSGVWDPAIEAPKPRNALARVPTGYDTDQPSDFVILKRPRLKILYPNWNTYIWQEGETYEILWTATNPNGEDSELKIDIYYVSKDGEVLIAHNTENDGAYEWTVPTGLRRCISIKIVAIGPENPLINRIKRSCDICIERVCVENCDGSMVTELKTTSVQPVPEDTSTSTIPVLIIEENASSTASSTPEIIDPVSTTTPDVVENTASSTEESLPVDSASTTDPMIAEDIKEEPATTTPMVESDSSEGDSSADEGDSKTEPNPEPDSEEEEPAPPADEPAIEEEPVIMPEPDSPEGDSSGDEVNSEPEPDSSADEVNTEPDASVDDSSVDEVNSELESDSSGEEVKSETE